MNDKDRIVLSIVEDALGNHRKTKADNPQKYFNCKSNKCYRDKNKYNLSFNAESKIFKCWKCGVKGGVHTLIKIFGNENNLERLKLILPHLEYKIDLFSKPKIDHDSITCELPKEAIPLWIPNDSFKYKKALEYVTCDRKISIEDIQKYQIRYTEDGPKKMRIILPSFNSSGLINYYEARSYFDKIKQSYMKPDYPDKDDIIFNEKFINWDLPVILTEGVFDAIRLPNSIPLLGKIIPSYLIYKLMKHKPKVILCFDDDAIEDLERAFNNLTSLGLDVYYIDLQNKEDPSKIFEKKGKDGIKEILNNVRKLTFQHFIIKQLQNE